jgi:hypothetical protein
MDHHRIYLSGPIAGLTFVESTQWRYDVFEELADFAEILDPMRDVQPPVDDKFTPNGVGLEFVSTADVSMMSDRGILSRDYNDTTTSTILFVNLLGSKKTSIGTVAEIAWAYQARIPVVIIMEQSGNPHDHPFIRDMASYRVDSIERAIKVTRSIIGVPQQW